MLPEGAYHNSRKGTCEENSLLKLRSYIWVITRKPGHYQKDLKKLGVGIHVPLGLEASENCSIFTFTLFPFYIQNSGCLVILLISW